MPTEHAHARVAFRSMLVTLRLDRQPGARGAHLTASLRTMQDRTARMIAVHEPMVQRSGSAPACRTRAQNAVLRTTGSPP